MRISGPSAIRTAAVAMLAVAAAALAQDSSREKIGAAGDAALEKIQSALGKTAQPAEARPDPRPQTPSEADRQRAIEGLQTRRVDPAILRRARAAVIAGDEALAKERDAQGRRLRQALGLEPGADEASVQAKPPTAANSWVPLLFVSSSMPIATLRSYAAQLERVHGVLAFRGMPGGLHKVGPMAKLTAQILRIDPGCEGPNCIMRDVQLVVDPIVFRQHGVTRVPALAMVPGDPARAYCERDDESARAAYLVFGDSALPGLLEEYARLGGRKEVEHVQALASPR